jgi:hypothetical protein
MPHPSGKGPPAPTNIHPAVRGAEEAANACWKLAAATTGRQPGARRDHEVAGWLLGAVDALGVVLRTTAHRIQEGDSSPDAAAERWQAADRALSVRVG